MKTMLPFKLLFFKGNIVGMSNILWNKFDRVIELQLEGKTIREISREVHISFRDILKIIKVYDRKVRLQQSKKIQQKEQVIIDNII